MIKRERINLIITLLAASALQIKAGNTNSMQSGIITPLEINENGRQTLKSRNKLLQDADTIAIGTAARVELLNEATNLIVNGISTQVLGVDTTFMVLKILKGDPLTNQIVMHHYIPANGNSREVVAFNSDSPNSYINNLLPPGLISFTPNSTNEFEIYLTRNKGNNFSPASGQSDASFSVRWLPPPWDSSYRHDANPFIREYYEFETPTKLQIQKVGDILKIRADPNSLVPTNISIGTNMTIGMSCDVFIYQADTSRPSNFKHYLEPMTGPFTPNASVTQKLQFDFRSYYWRLSGDEVAVPLNSVPSFTMKNGNQKSDKTHDVEMQLYLFETDSFKVNPHWNPQHARYYKVLWQETLNGLF
jgi:hypothetical protein